MNYNPVIIELILPPDPPPRTPLVFYVDQQARIAKGPGAVRSLFRRLFERYNVLNIVRLCEIKLITFITLRPPM